MSEEKNTFKVKTITASKKGVTVITTMNEHRHLVAGWPGSVRHIPHAITGYACEMLFEGRSESKHIVEWIDYHRDRSHIDAFNEWNVSFFHEEDECVVIHFPELFLEDHPGRCAIAVYDILTNVYETVADKNLYGRTFQYEVRGDDVHVKQQDYSNEPSKNNPVTRTERYVVTHKTDSEGNAILGVPANVEHVETVVHTPVAGAAQKKYHVAEDVGFGPGGGIASHTNDTFGKM